MSHIVIGALRSTATAGPVSLTAPCTTISVSQPRPESEKLNVSTKVAPVLR